MGHWSPSHSEREEGGMERGSERKKKKTKASREKCSGSNRDLYKEEWKVEVIR